MQPNYGCVQCSTMLRPRKNSVLVEIREDNRTYQVWQADLWECPGCGYQLISGPGQKPLAEWHDPDKLAGFMPEIDYTLDNKLRALSDE